MLPLSYALGVGVLGRCVEGVLRMATFFNPECGDRLASIPCGTLDLLFELVIVRT